MSNLLLLDDQLALARYTRLELSFTYMECEVRILELSFPVSRALPEIEELAPVLDIHTLRQMSSTLMNLRKRYSKEE
jgi:hypothetical protein